MILCHCGVVGHEAVDHAVESGARTLDDVLAACGAGRDCGGCVPAIRQRAEAALREAGHHHLAPSSEVVHAAS